jgi:glycosyltransferase involved in cell wall biosynthesis
MSAGPVVLDTRVVAGSGGGPDKTILNSPRYLASGGYRMLCAYMHPPGDPGFEQIRKKAEALDAPLLSIPDRGPWDVGVLRALLRICRRERVAIWHGHDYKSNLFGLLLRPFWPMKLVTTVHGWVHFTRKTPLYYRIDKLCLPRYERVICVSADLHDRCRALGVPERRCELIENGIDTTQYCRRESPREAKARLGIPAERLVIGAIGRLSREKGFDLLIRATDRLLAKGHDLELIIAGEGDHRERLAQLIAELARQDRVRLLGYHPDVNTLYEAMDVFALSSLREGLPNVVLEAMAMEVPVVATRVAGVPRLIQAEETGLLVELGSADSLADSLERLLSDPELRERLRISGRRAVVTRHGFEVRMGRIRAIYDALLSGSKC